MSIIGSFIRDKDGNWIGTIRTLTINAKLRLIPNENRDNDKAPSFRAFIGRSRIGDAWPARSTGDNPRDYLRVRLDDPILPEPISAALFEAKDGKEAHLVWNRRADQR